MNTQLKAVDAMAKQEVIAQTFDLPGVDIKLGGQTFVVPPLNVKGLEKHDADIFRVTTDPTLRGREKMDVLCQIICTAIQRNYKDMTVDYVKEWVDMANAGGVFEAVMAVSGFKKEAPKAGEKRRAR